ncbi:sulfurtransferase [Candidatus Sumerlaeota bacterium]|nr:sulfurtransferase [Candidatus Sumerlaeota bacterium]
MKRTRMYLNIGALLATGLILCSCAATSRGPYGLPLKTGFDAFPRSGMFVSAEELRHRYTDPSVVLIDGRAAEKYKEGHLPGAVNMPIAKWREGEPNFFMYRLNQSPDAVWSAGRYESMLGLFGVTPENDIYVYGNPSESYESLFAAYVLYWLGHEKLHVVDGDVMEFWIDAGLPVDFNTAFREPASYTANPRMEALWTRDRLLAEVRDQPEDFVLWDCRTEEEYKGEVILPHVMRAGHIRGAVNFPLENIFREYGHYQLRYYSELSRLLDKAGISKGKRVCVYSHDGSRAFLAAYTLVAMGFNNVSVYEHSWIEWSADERLPVLRQGAELPKHRIAPARPNAQPRRTPGSTEI